jgi:hypothetical protein
MKVSKKGGINKLENIVNKVIASARLEPPKEMPTQLKFNF